MTNRLSLQTDARVETVTESMLLSHQILPSDWLVHIAVGVLRMVKLFGWEKKMSDKIKEKREEELKWLWKDKVSYHT